MKKIWMAAGLSLMVGSTVISCKKGPNDAEIQTQATNVVSTVPGASVEIKDGVAHLHGTFADAQSRDKVIADLKALKGVKDVHDMTQIAAAPTVNTTVVTTTTAEDPAVMQRVKDALKDYPSAKVEMVNGEMIITGNVSQTQARQIKQSVDALNIKNVKYNYVVQ